MIGTYSNQLAIYHNYQKKLNHNASKNLNETETLKIGLENLKKVTLTLLQQAYKALSRECLDNSLSRFFSHVMARSGKFFLLLMSS